MTFYFAFEPMHFCPNQLISM